MVITDGLSGGTPKVNLIDDISFSNVPAGFSGLIAGSPCGTLRFQMGAASFTTALSPYAGIFAPAADNLVGTPTSQLNGHTYTLGITSGGVGNVTLECWNMTLTLGPQ